jgi:hypothetical protein
MKGHKGIGDPAFDRKIETEIQNTGERGRKDERKEEGFDR